MIGEIFLLLSLCQSQIFKKLCSVGIGTFTRSLFTNLIGHLYSLNL